MQLPPVGVSEPEQPDLGVERAPRRRRDLDHTAFCEGGELRIARRNVYPGRLAEHGCVSRVPANRLQQRQWCGSVDCGRVPLVIGRHGERCEEDGREVEGVRRRQRDLDGEAIGRTQGIGEQVSALGLKH